MASMSHIPTSTTIYSVRVFEVPPGTGGPPAPLPDREVEAASVEDARAQAMALLAAERRPVRSIAFLAEGGLVAYVLPPEPAPEERARPRARRRRV
jgi:hypothetical protein